MTRRAFKYVSLVMTVLILAVSVLGTCACVCAEGTHEGSKEKPAHCLKQEVPTSQDHDADPDHSECSFNCPCHAPLTVQPLQILSSPAVAPLFFPEPFEALPEVYLPTFVPPHINA